MNLDGIVRKYFEAWNRLDVAGLLELMHPGAAYYDAFWMETCVGRDLPQYFQDAMDEEPYWYKQVGDTMSTDTGVVTSYSAHERSGAITGEPILYGADILNLRGTKILTVTDNYCSPDRSALAEVAGFAAKHHGLPSHANSELGALKMARIKAELSIQVDNDKAYLDPIITLAQPAEKIGCTLEQLSIIIKNQFGTSFGNFLDSQRVEHARELLAKNPDRVGIVEQVANQVGFSSVREFSVKFAGIVGIAPARAEKHLAG